jgi:hypothetical protein
MGSEMEEKRKEHFLGEERKNKNSNGKGGKLRIVRD